MLSAEKGAIFNKEVITLIEIVTVRVSGIKSNQIKIK